MTDETSETQHLNDLDTRLRAARAREHVESGREEPRNGKSGQGMGLGFRIAVELVAGIVVGTLIGYFLDSLTGTRPLLMVVFFFLGSAAGVMNVYRAAKGYDASVGLGQAQRRKEQDRTNGS